ncbi:MAG: hypothetical protein R6V83_05225 [Candidatus Thorarchaeota archaeon]
MSSKFITRLSIWFNSEGAAPSEVIHKLLELGFTPIRGAYDFVYEHNEDVQDDITNAILEISNALHKTLAGFNVMYTLDTHRADEDEDYIPLEDIDAELEATRQEIEALEEET